MLTLEEFAWQSRWLEVGRLASQYGDLYGARHTRAMARRVVRDAEAGVVWPGRYGDRSEWAGMVRGWYRGYLTEQAEQAEQATPKPKPQRRQTA